MATRRRRREPQTGEQQTVGQKVVMVDIMRRFMREEEISNFIRQYRSNLFKQHRVSDRSETLGERLTPEELDALRWYVEDTDVSVKEMAEQMNITYGRLVGLAQRAAVKWIFQHQQDISLDE